jgi:hypothetical protein
MKKWALLLVLSSLCVASAARAEAVSIPSNAYKQQFFYAGLMTGYGDSDWNDVVVKPGWENLPVLVANPYSAEGDGILYGADFGYQFSPHFAIEGEYIRMPTSELAFVPDSINIDGDIIPLPNAYGLSQASIDSNMDVAAVLFKVMAPIQGTAFAIFVDAGPAYQYRSDVIAHIGTWAPTFGGGLTYRIAEHWQAEGSFQYAPGTGKSIDNPMIAYIPEIYAGTFKLDYIF